MAAVAGVAILAAAFALLQVLRRRDVQTTARAEWIDTSLALTLTAAVGSGVMLIVVGVFALLSAYF